MLAEKNTIQIEYQNKAAQLLASKGQKKVKVKRNPWGRYCFIVAIAVVIAIAIIARYVEIAQSSYEIGKLKYSVAALEKENETLQINIVSLKAPGRIQEIAVSRLGMQLPDKVYYASVLSAVPQKQADAATTPTTDTPWGASKAEAHSSN